MNKISIIIPLYIVEERFFRDLKKFEKLKYPEFEIIIVCDKKIEIPKLGKLKIRSILTKKKKTGPAEKRDLGLISAKGKYCAFIDDDAYPDRNWLKNAILDFQDNRIAAVGGPGVTPPEDGYREKLTGLVYDSYFCGGGARHRFKPEKMRFVEDFPAYNLIIRKDVLEKVGGYGNYFYGGEDTFLCLKIIKTGFRILYDPEVIVYHHRRPLFLPYLRQISNVGIHRGYFVKKFPETSLLYFYFIPSTLTLGFFLGLSISFVNKGMLISFSILLAFFLLLGFASVIRKTSPKNSLIVSVAIILTHLTYGTFFVKGLLTRSLKR